MQLIPRHLKMADRVSGRFGVFLLNPCGDVQEVASDMVAGRHVIEVRASPCLSNIRNQFSCSVDNQ